MVVTLPNPKPKSIAVPNPIIVPKPTQSPKLIAIPFPTPLAPSSPLSLLVQDAAPAVDTKLLIQNMLRISFEEPNAVGISS
jgi:hypothetical protein